MKKTSFKVLYNFTKKLKMKDSTSTKDLDDSLDNNQVEQKIICHNPPKNLHQRTQSCPFISESKLFKKTMQKKKESSNLVKEGQANSIGTCSPEKIKKKKRLAHQYSNSQISFSSNTNTANSFSIDNLSSGLYRRNTKQKLLKKGTNFVINSNKANPTFIGINYERTKLEQQMKTYALTEELKKIEKQSNDIGMRQQILQDLLRKYESQAN